MLKKIFLIIFATINFIQSYKYELAVCAIFQDEGPYLKEWLEFHKLVGAQHFYLYNNFSTDNYKDVLEPYIKNNEVELFDWPVHADPKTGHWILSAYNDALKKAKNEVKWLSYLDLDEFLFPVEKDNLIEFLEDYSDYATIAINWVMFGTSFIKKIKDGQLLIEALTYRAPINFNENLHVKLIVRPDLTISIDSPHYATYLPNYFRVTSDKKVFEGPWSPYVVVDKIRINHYWSRDEEFFYTTKIKRRLIDMGDSKENSINRNNKLNQEVDKTIFKFIPKLKHSMQK